MIPVILDPPFYIPFILRLSIYDTTVEYPFILTLKVVPLFYNPIF